MTAWLCSSLCSPCNNVYCRGRSYGLLGTPAWKGPACDCFIYLMRTKCFCHFELFEKLPPDRFFEDFAREPQIHIVGVHLHEFEIPPIDEIVQTIVIKLQHSQLNQFHPERPVDRHFLFSKLSRTRGQSRPCHRTTPTLCFVHYTLVPCVYHPCLSFFRLD